MAHILRPEAGGNPNAIAVRIKGRNLSNVAGQRRHDLRIGAQPNYVDTSKSHLNRVLIEPWTGPKLRDESERRRSLRSTERAMKSNAGIAMVGIITFGTQAQKRFNRLTNAKQDAAFIEIAKAIAKRLNTTLTGLVVHRDESAIHAHFQMVGYNLDGDPVSDQTKKKDTSELQDLAAEIIAKYDPRIERGRRIKERIEGGAKPHEIINRQVALLHRDLPAEIEELREEIARLRKQKTKLERNIKRIEDRETRTAKQEKNMSIYEQRLEEKAEQLDDREARILELEDLALELERRQLKAERAADDAEKRQREAEEMRDWAFEAEQKARLETEESLARKREVLHPNRIDDLPALLREAVDEKAENNGYLPLDQMQDHTEKEQSIATFLHNYIRDIAAQVFESMEKTITDLRRQYRNALKKVTELKGELKAVLNKNTELTHENDALKKENQRLRSINNIKGPEPD